MKHVHSDNEQHILDLQYCYYCAYQLSPCRCSALQHIGAETNDYFAANANAFLNENFSNKSSSKDIPWGLIDLKPALVQTMVRYPKQATSHNLNQRWASLLIFGRLSVIHFSFCFLAMNKSTSKIQLIYVSKGGSMGYIVSCCPLDAPLLVTNQSSRLLATQRRL